MKATATKRMARLYAPMMHLFVDDVSWYPIGVLWQVLSWFGSSMNARFSSSMVLDSPASGCVSRYG